MEKIIYTGMGADPEVFLQNKLTNAIVSAEGYIQGTKDKPFSFDATQKMFGISLDNVLAEFTIPPAQTAEQFYAYLQKGLNYINSVVPKELCTAIIPAANLAQEYLQTPQALIFGCEPDVNAYTQWVNKKPKADDATLRSAGGHIHVGYKNAWEVFDLQYPDEEVLGGDTTRQQLVKALDLFVGVPSVIWEPDNKRKQLYGSAGAYRPKPYGLEYRTISNYYLANEQLTKTIYNQVIKAINWLNQGNQVDKELGEYVQATINGNDKAVAAELIADLQLTD